MDQFILLSEYENTFFIFHEQKVETSKQSLYNVYRAFDHLKLLNDKNSTVLIFNILDDANMDVISIQHKDASLVRNFDKNNLEEVFNSLKQMDSQRKIFVLNYHFDKEMYETLVIEGTVSIKQSMNIANIEYVQYMGQPEESTSNDDLSSPLNLDMAEIVEEPKAVEDDASKPEEPKVEGEEAAAAAEKPAETTVEAAAAEEPKVEAEAPLIEPSTPVVRKTNKFG